MDNLICLKNKGNFTCDICGNVLKSRKTIQNHLRLSHIKKAIAAYCCKKCDRKFVFNAELLQHNLKVHFEDEKFECKCGKFYRNKSYLNYCIASHKGSKHECEVVFNEKNVTFNLMKTFLHRSVNASSANARIFVSIGKELTSKNMGVYH